MFITRQEYKAPINLQAITRGAIISLFITLVFIFAAAIFTFYMNDMNQWLSGITITLYLLSCFLGGVISAKIAGFKGLWHGILAGLLIFIIAFIISVFIVPGHLVFGYMLKKLFVSLVAGAIGGIAGSL